jgi:outer membrane protein OmpA-like peptidoglycan-associated protein
MHEATEQMPPKRAGNYMDQRFCGTAAAVVMAAGIVLMTGCSKFIEAQSGSKSMDRTGSTQGQDLASAPSLAVSPGAQGSAGDLVIAKAEPRAGAMQRMEEMREDQVATAAAGLQDVFFEFDRWAIPDGGRQALLVSAEWLRSNPNKKLLIQGHCDDRGTSAYNLLLGDKRARSIRQYLLYRENGA